ncbi:AAA family ATPase [Catellatospora sp. NPDC049609]|uniref:AAA family ATPase n=1 Tax=Catellatospora sp. NPDC049609 TaxID=3155505 RepID=UPI00341940C5
MTESTEPVEGLRPPGGPVRLEDRPTRKRLPFWDRIKFLFLFAIAWLVLVWATIADFPGGMPFREAALIQLTEARWLLILAGVEVLRQLHFLVSEHWSGYHRFWTHRVFGGFERTTHRRLSDWTRFRLARWLKWLFWIAVFAVVAGAVLDTSPVLALFQAPAILWSLLPFILQLVFILAVVILQFVAIFWFLSRGGVEVYYPDDIKTRFTDVWGQDHVLARVKENIVFLERPEEIEAKGGYVPSGLLLWGPPGTGKTLMAEAVAGETGKPYVFVDPGAFTNMFMGVGILKVKSLFRKLRKLALRYGGVIVFFDEADALGSRGMLAQGGGPGFPRGMSPAFGPAADGCHGRGYLSPETQWRLARHAAAELRAEAPPEAAGRRSRFVMGAGMGGGAGMGTLQALLTELSGLKKPRGFVNRYVRRLLGMRPKPPPRYRILVMMATNLPEALDEALLRPGRIDRIYKVGYPSKAGRVRTYEGYLGKVRHELTSAQIDKLATITPYATGATIKDLINEALITAIRDGREVIAWRDVMRAKQLKELGPPEDVEYIERERHAVAVHEACHAVIAYRTRHHMEIDIATIEKGSDYLGMVASIPPEDQFTRWRTEYESDICVSLASLAGERLFFGGDSSSGVSGDLESATTVASFMEGYWGMGSTVSSYSTAKRLEVGAPGGGQGGRRKKGQDTEADIRRALADRIEDMLSELLERTGQMLVQHRRDVLALAHALETHKTLTGDDVVAVLEGRPGPAVDGTLYRSEEFLTQLDAYHEAAVTAHLGHSRITMALPATSVTPLPD